MLNLYKNKITTKKSQEKKKVEFLKKNASENNIKKLLYFNNSNCCGINYEQREKKIKKNILKFKKKNKFLIKIYKFTTNPFIIITLTIDLWYFVQYFILNSKDIGDLISFLLILGTVIFSITIDFLQDISFYRFNKKLKKKIQNKINVLFVKNNDHHEKEKKYAKNCIKNLDNWNFIENNLIKIETNQIVEGDLLFFTPGDIIPSDCRIIRSQNLFLNEANLTGETFPVFKNDKLNSSSLSNVSLTKFNNICYAGASVITGVAIGIVIFTNEDTFFYQIIKKTIKKRKKHNFEIKIKEISLTMLKLISIFAPLVFFFSFFKTWDYIKALTFAITITIGLTPEILPMIISISLIRTSKKLNKKKTIVKNLSAIQNLGAMNVLCCDKTGTLTKNKLEIYKSVSANKAKGNNFVAKLAYLNSVFQTNKKNVIDQTIIAKYSSLFGGKILQKYKKLSEISFDSFKKTTSIFIQNKTNKKKLYICKGQVKEVMKKCILSKEESEKIIKQKTYFSNKGYRTIGIAYKNNNFNDNKKFIFIGFIVLINNLKIGIKKIINKIKEKNVKIKILTGDEKVISINICKQLEISSKNYLLGTDIDKLTDKFLIKKLKNVNLFAELNPFQKERIVKLLKKEKNVVGFLGDGINDAPVLSQADVGIAVKNAVEVVKENADLIITKNDLNIINTAITSGRRSFINIFKYIKITISSQVGDVLSVLISALILPAGLIPISASQMLFKNLIYDMSQLFVSWDKTDKKQIIKPVNWKKEKMIIFSFWNGIISPLFDISFFLIIGYGFWKFLNDPINTNKFQTSWFFFCLLMQSLAIHIMRTEKIPFLQSRSSWHLLLSTILVILWIILINFKIIPFFNVFLKLESLDKWLILFIIFLNVIYCFVMQGVKKLYISFFREWI